MYINGAIALPSASTIKPPKISIRITIGKSQNFFLTLKNSQNSIIKSMLHDSQNCLFNDSGSGPGGYLFTQ